jgi:hypothetical protein
MHCGVLMLPILWGMPGPSAYEAEQRGELIVGGSCMVSPMNPKWQCSVCGLRHYPMLRRSKLFIPMDSSLRPAELC